VNSPMISLDIDDQTVSVEKGTTILDACLTNNIFVPNLCFLKTDEFEHKPASCRLCFVEVKGEPDPVASCVTKVQKDMIVKTDTPEVRKLQKRSLKLLLSVHDIDCKNCLANKNFQLQKLAQYLKVKLKRDADSPHMDKPFLVSDHPVFDLFPNRCVLCEKCIAVCIHESPVQVLTFLGRGMDTMVGFFQDTADLYTTCHTCRKCLSVCPVGALVEK